MWFVFLYFYNVTDPRVWRGGLIYKLKYTNYTLSRIIKSYTQYVVKQIFSSVYE